MFCCVHGPELQNVDLHVFPKETSKYMETSKNSPGELGLRNRHCPLKCLSHTKVDISTGHVQAYSHLSHTTSLPTTDMMSYPRRTVRARAAQPHLARPHISHTGHSHCHLATHKSYLLYNQTHNSEPRCTQPLHTQTHPLPCIPTET